VLGLRKRYFCILLPILKLSAYINTKMWFSQNVCEIVGVFVTFCVAVAISGSETEDLARGTLLCHMVF